MLLQLGRRWTIVAALSLVLFVLIVLLNLVQPFGAATLQPSITKIEDKEQLESWKNQLLGGGKTPEDVKQEMAHDKPTAEEPEWPSREFPDPNPPGPSKVVVMGKITSEDTEWVHELRDWHNAVYCVDLEPGARCHTGFRTNMNKAREAMPYLTYIIDHYATLPDVMAFVHPHRSGMPKAWHNDARKHDAVIMLRDLRLETVLKRGYVNLRCILEPGCPAELQPFRDPPLPDAPVEVAYKYFYANFFDASFEEMQGKIATVATPCCAQFAVSREQVLQRPLAVYERIRTFLEETHYEDEVSGRVMEYMWHVLFGREAVHCDDTFECWCEVFGRCGPAGMSISGGMIDALD